MQLTLKQRYLTANAPSAPAFDEERTRNFQKLLVLISTTERAKWLSTGFNCGSLIEAYKQVYGLTSQQLETLLTLLSNIALKEEGLSTETRVFILRLVNTLTELQIKITDNFSISNKKLIELLQSYANEGVDGTLRNSDAVVEELSKFTMFFSRFGEEVVEEALGLSIDYNDIRYLVIFLRSIRTESAAKRLLGELFSDNNLWDRDSFWFFILSELIKKFPRLDYSAYYQTIMQEVIKAFTTLIDGDNEDAVKKLTASDAFLQVQPALKSVALALAYLLLPDSQPQHVFIKACVQRLFNIVITSLDHINPPDYLNDLLGFIKAFVRAYLLRYRGERGMYLLYNEDVLEDHHEPNDKDLLVDSSVEEFFDSLWDEVIPKIVYLEDADECKPSKIIAELCMYKPQRFLEASMQAVLTVTSREDPTLVSLHGAKITILFLQEYIITDRKEHLSAYISACSSLLASIEKLGVPENLDIVQLVFRSFMYLNDEQMDLPQVQSLVEDSLAMVLNNLEPMSIGLEGSEGEQAELYIDLSNIFFPFLLRLDQKQLSSFAQRFTYRLINQIPQHEEAYEMISIALTYIDPNFADAVFKHILKELLSDQPRQPPVQAKESKESKEEPKQEPKSDNNQEVVQNGEMVVEGEGQEEDEGQDEAAGWQFITPVQGSLHARNEQALKWFTSLLQCIFQYHPKNVLKHWKQIERVINLLLVEWEEQSYLEIALDIIYNIILCLCKPHLPASNFTKPANADYRTLSLDWIHVTPEVKALIDEIYEKYYQGVEKYLRNAYGEELKSNQKEVATLGDFESYLEKNQHGDVIRIRKRNLKLVDYVLMPQVTDPQDSEDRKIIYRALSLQYTVLSALMVKVPFHAGLQNIGDFFTEQRYLFMRKRSCEYLQWVLQLLGHFDLMAEEAFTKIFNFYWRESHDEVSYTAAIVATNEKISPYYYPQLHRKKELLRSSFLIVNEAYLVHMVRLEFHLILAPTAHLNNPRYLESNFILGLNSSYEPSLHSYFPPYVEVHQYHRELVAICRYHLDASNSEGYLAHYLSEQDPGKKERLGTAVRSLMVGMKRLLNVFSDNCCMRDQFIRNTVFELISLYKILPKKTDKTLLYEMVYVMLVFSFDPLCLSEGSDYSLSRYWTLRSQNSPEIANYQIVSIKETPNLSQIIEQLQRSEVQFLEMVAMGRGLKLTRSCSFEHEVDLPKQMERAVSYLIKKIEEGMPGLEKDFGVYLLMLLLYSNNLAVEHPLIGDLITLLFKLCQLDSLEIFDMSKTGLFHLLNRFNYHKRTSRIVTNTPIRRSWSQFLTYKYLGGDPTLYQSMKCEKNDQNFYPSKELTIYQYGHLASDEKSPSIANQRILLNVLQDEAGMLKFLKNCSRDPDLKQNQLPTEAAVVNEEDFKSISSSAHKLMHFIWDCNPSKTPLFMGVLERYQASPLNFYNRFFRKALRIGGEKARQVCANITAQLRAGEPEEIRLSFYISCELMMRSPSDQINRPFLDYLGECTKENFDFALMGFYGIFTSNFVTAQRNYQVLLQKLRSLKGAPRFRHFQLLNTYMISQGRFARGAATEAAELLLKGISEGGDEISEAVVSMITECFVQAVNLKLFDEWVQQSKAELVQAKKLYLLNEYVGYNDEELLIVLLTELMKKAREEEEHVESTKLRIYSQIVRKILASITIYRFNNYFYKLLRELILFVLERPQSLEGDAADSYVVVQLSDSEYPQEIYQDLVTQLLPMTDRTPYVVKKKLIFLQGLIIHRSFRLNRVEIPPLLSLNEKLITLDYIITVSTIARLMTPEEITAEVQHLLGAAHRKKHETYRLIALLLASGVREYEWKERVIRDLIKHKKDKLVKESISQWWKGKTPETPQELRIAELVRNFENPYSYFA